MNYFELFNLPEAPEIDLELLDINYYRLISKLHTDSGMQELGAEQAVSAQEVNFAYRTLKNEINRLKYLLTILGFGAEIQIEDVDFLMQFLTYQEDLEQISTDRVEIELLKQKVLTQRNALLLKIKEEIHKAQYTSAQENIAKLNFYSRITEQIIDKEEKLDEVI